MSFFVEPELLLEECLSEFYYALNREFYENAESDEPDADMAGDAIQIGSMRY